LRFGAWIRPNSKSHSLDEVEDEGLELWEAIRSMRKKTKKKKEKKKKKKKKKKEKDSLPPSATIRNFREPSGTVANNAPDLR
jgi:hypothetical protein